MSLKKTEITRKQQKRIEKKHEVERQNLREQEKDTKQRNELKKIEMKGIETTRKKIWNMS